MGFFEIWEEAEDWRDRLFLILAYLAATVVGLAVGMAFLSLKVGVIVVVAKKVYEWLT